MLTLDSRWLWHIETNVRNENKKKKRRQKVNYLLHIFSFSETFEVHDKLLLYISVRLDVSVVGSR